MSELTYLDLIDPTGSDGSLDVTKMIPGANELEFDTTPKWYKKAVNSKLSLEQKAALVDNSIFEKQMVSLDGRTKGKLHLIDGDSGIFYPEGDEKGYRVRLSDSLQKFDTVDSYKNIITSPFKLLNQPTYIKQLTGIDIDTLEPEQRDALIENVKNYHLHQVVNSFSPDYKFEPYNPAIAYDNNVKDVEAYIKVNGTDKDGRLLISATNSDTKRNVSFEVANNPYLNTAFDVYGTVQSRKNREFLKQMSDLDIANTKAFIEEMGDTDGTVGEFIDMCKSNIYQEFAKFMSTGIASKLGANTEYWKAIASRETGQMLADAWAGVKKSTRYRQMLQMQEGRELLKEGDVLGSIEAYSKGIDTYISSTAGSMLEFATANAVMNGVCSLATYLYPPIGVPLTALVNSGKAGKAAVALFKTLISAGLFAGTAQTISDNDEYRQLHGTEMTNYQLFDSWYKNTFSLVPDAIFFNSAILAKIPTGKVLSSLLGKAATSTVDSTLPRFTIGRALRNVAGGALYGLGNEFGQEPLQNAVSRANIETPLGGDWLSSFKSQWKGEKLYDRLEEAITAGMAGGATAGATGSTHLVFSAPRLAYQQNQRLKNSAQTAAETIANQKNTLVGTSDNVALQQLEAETSNTEEVDTSTSTQVPESSNVDINTLNSSYNDTVASTLESIPNEWTRKSLSKVIQDYANNKLNEKQAKEEIAVIVTHLVMPEGASSTQYWAGREEDYNKMADAYNKYIDIAFNLLSETTKYKAEIANLNSTIKPSTVSDQQLQQQVNSPVVDNAKQFTQEEKTAFTKIKIDANNNYTEALKKFSGDDYDFTSSIDIKKFQQDLELARKQSGIKDFSNLATASEMISQFNARLEAAIMSHALYNASKKVLDIINNSKKGTLSQPDLVKCINLATMFEQLKDLNSFKGVKNSLEETHNSSFFTKTKDGKYSLNFNTLASALRAIALHGNPVENYFGNFMGPATGNTANPNNSGYVFTQEYQDRRKREADNILKVFVKKGLLTQEEADEAKLKTDLAIKSKILARVAAGSNNGFDLTLKDVIEGILTTADSVSSYEANLQDIVANITKIQETLRDNSLSEQEKANLQNTLTSLQGQINTEVKKISKLISNQQLVISSILDASKSLTSEIKRLAPTGKLDDSTSITIPLSYDFKLKLPVSFVFLYGTTPNPKGFEKIWHTAIIDYRKSIDAVSRLANINIMPSSLISTLEASLTKAVLGMNETVQEAKCAKVALEETRLNPNKKNTEVITKAELARVNSLRLSNDIVNEANQLFEIQTYDPDAQEGTFNSYNRNNLGISNTTKSLKSIIKGSLRDFINSKLKRYAAIVNNEMTAFNSHFDNDGNVIESKLSNNKTELQNLLNNTIEPLFKLAKWLDSTTLGYKDHILYTSYYQQLTALRNAAYNRLNTLENKIEGQQEVDQNDAFKNNPAAYSIIISPNISKTEGVITDGLWIKVAKERGLTIKEAKRSKKGEGHSRKHQLDGFVSRLFIIASKDAYTKYAKAKKRNPQDQLIDDAIKANKEIFLFDVGYPSKTKPKFGSHTWYKYNPTTKAFEQVNPSELKLLEGETAVACYTKFNSNEQIDESLIAEKAIKDLLENTISSTQIETQSVPQIESTETLEESQETPEQEVSEEINIQEPTSVENQEEPSENTPEEKPYTGYALHKEGEYYKIYGGILHRENSVLSNFAERPFVYDCSTFTDGPTDPVEFVCVEQAYQTLKNNKFDKEVYDDWVKASQSEESEGYYVTYDDLNGGTYKIFDASKILKHTPVDINTNINLLTNLMFTSFNFNERAKETLVSTGNAGFIHPVSSSFWRTNFPACLITVRKKLTGQILPNIAPNILQEDASYVYKDIMEFLRQNYLKPHLLTIYIDTEEKELFRNPVFATLFPQVFPPALKEALEKMTRDLNSINDGKRYLPKLRILTKDRKEIFAAPGIFKSKENNLEFFGIRKLGDTPNGTYKTTELKKFNDLRRRPGAVEEHIVTKDLINYQYSKTKFAPYLELMNLYGNEWNKAVLDSGESTDYYGFLQGTKTDTILSIIKAINKAKEDTTLFDNVCIPTYTTGNILLGLPKGFNYINTMAKIAKQYAKNKGIQVVNLDFKVDINPLTYNVTDIYLNSPNEERLELQLGRSAIIVPIKFTANNTIVNNTINALEAQNLLYRTLNYSTNHITDKLYTLLTAVMAKDKTTTTGFKFNIDDSSMEDIVNYYNTLDNKGITYTLDAKEGEEPSSFTSLPMHVKGFNNNPFFNNRENPATVSFKKANSLVWNINYNKEFNLNEFLALPLEQRLEENNLQNFIQYKWLNNLKLNINNLNLEGGSSERATTEIFKRYLTNIAYPLLFKPVFSKTTLEDGSVLTSFKRLEAIEPTIAAVDMAVAKLIKEENFNGLTNLTVEDIKKYFNLENVTPYEYKKLKKLADANGLPVSTFANSLGKDIISLLGLSTNPEWKVADRYYLETSLGMFAIEYMQAQGLLTIDHESVDFEEFGKFTLVRFNNKAIKNSIYKGFDIGALNPKGKVSTLYDQLRSIGYIKDFDSKSIRFTPIKKPATSTDTKKKNASSPLSTLVTDSIDTLNNTPFELQDAYYKNFIKGIKGTKEDKDLQFFVDLDHLLVVNDSKDIVDFLRKNNTYIEWLLKQLDWKELETNEVLDETTHKIVEVESFVDKEFEATSTYEQKDSTKGANKAKEAEIIALAKATLLKYKYNLVSDIYPTANINRRKRIDKELVKKFGFANADKAQQFYYEFTQSTNGRTSIKATDINSQGMKQIIRAMITKHTLDNMNRELDYTSIRPESSDEGYKKSIYDRHIEAYAICQAFDCAKSLYDNAKVLEAFDTYLGIINNQKSGIRTKKQALQRFEKLEHAFTSSNTQKELATNVGNLLRLKEGTFEKLENLGLALAVLEHFRDKVNNIVSDSDDKIIFYNTPVNCLSGNYTAAMVNSFISPLRLENDSATSGIALNSLAYGDYRNLAKTRIYVMDYEEGGSEAELRDPKTGRELDLSDIYDKTAEQLKKYNLDNYKQTAVDLTKNLNERINELRVPFGRKKGKTQYSPLTDSWKYNDIPLSNKIGMYYDHVMTFPELKKAEANSSYRHNVTSDIVLKNDPYYVLNGKVIPRNGTVTIKGTEIQKKTRGLFIALYNILELANSSTTDNGDTIWSVSSTLRNIMKPITMIFNYAAGRAKIKGQLADTIINDFILSPYMKYKGDINKMVEDGKKSIRKQQLEGKELRDATIKLQYLEYFYKQLETLVPNGTSLYELLLTKDLSQIGSTVRGTSLDVVLHTMIENTYGEEVWEALTERFEHRVAINEVSNQVPVVGYIMYRNALEWEMAKLSKKDINELTEKEMSTIEKHLKEIGLYPITTSLYDQKDKDVGPNESKYGVPMIDYSRYDAQYFDRQHMPKYIQPFTKVSGINNTTQTRNKNIIVSNGSSYTNYMMPNLDTEYNKQLNITSDLPVFSPGGVGPITMTTHFIDGMAAQLMQIIDPSTTMVYDALGISTSRALENTQLFNFIYGTLPLLTNSLEVANSTYNNLLHNYEEYVKNESDTDLAKVDSHYFDRLLTQNKRYFFLEEKAAEKAEKEGKNTSKYSLIRFEANLKSELNKVHESQEALKNTTIAISNINGSLPIEIPVRESVELLDQFITDLVELSKEELTKNEKAEKRALIVDKFKLDVFDLIKSVEVNMNSLLDIYSSQKEDINTPASENDSNSYDELTSYEENEQSISNALQDITNQLNIAKADEAEEKFRERLLAIKGNTYSYTPRKTTKTAKQTTTTKSTVKKPAKKKASTTTRKATSTKKRKPSAIQLTFPVDENTFGNFTDFKILNPVPFDSFKGSYFKEQFSTRLKDKLDYLNRQAKFNNTKVADQSYINYLTDLLSKLNLIEIDKFEVNLYEGFRSSSLISEINPDYHEGYISLFLESPDKTKVDNLDTIAGHSIYSFMSHVELLGHELMHRIMNPIAKYATQLGIKPMVDRMQDILEFCIEKNIINENTFMPTENYDPALTNEYKQLSKEIYEYITNNPVETPYRTLIEFCTYAMTNPTVISNLKNTYLPKLGKQSLFDRIKNFFNDIIKVFIGQSRIKDLMYKNRSVYDELYSLIQDCNHIIDNHINGRTTVPGLISHLSNSLNFIKKNVISIGNNVLIPITKTASDIFGKLHINVPYEKFPLASLVTFPIDAKARAALGNFVHSLWYNDMFSMLSILYDDVKTPDDLTYKLQAMNALTRNNDAQMKDIEAITQLNILNAFDKKELTDVESTSLTTLGIFTNLQALYDDSDASVTNIKNIINNDSLRQSYINTLENSLLDHIELFDEAPVYNKNLIKNSIINQCKQLGIYMSTGYSFMDLHVDIDSMLHYLINEVHTYEDMNTPKVKHPYIRLTQDKKPLLVDNIRKLSSLYALDYTIKYLLKDKANIYKQAFTNLSDKGIKEFLATLKTFYKDDILKQFTSTTDDITKYIANTKRGERIEGRYAAIYDSRYKFELMNKQLATSNDVQKKQGFKNIHDIDNYEFRNELNLDSVNIVKKLNNERREGATWVNPAFYRIGLSFALQYDKMFKSPNKEDRSKALNKIMSKFLAKQIYNTQHYKMNRVLNYEELVKSKTDVVALKNPNFIYDLHVVVPTQTKINEMGMSLDALKIIGKMKANQLGSFNGEIRNATLLTFLMDDMARHVPESFEGQTFIYSESPEAKSVRYITLLKKYEEQLRNGEISQQEFDEKQKIIDEQITNLDDSSSAFSHRMIYYEKITKNSKNEQIRELYKLLPQHIRERLETSSSHFYVRKEWIPLLFGVPNKSIVNAKFFREMDYNHKKIVALGEDILKTTAILSKSQVATRLPKVVIGNLISNFVYSLSEGHSFSDVFSAQRENAYNLRDYANVKTEYDKLLLRKENKTATQLELSKLKRLKQRLDDNPISPLIKKGMYQSIIEDVRIQDMEDSSETLKKVMNSKFVKSTPDWVKTGFKWVYGTQEVPWYQFAYRTVQCSDFIARCAEYQLSIKELDKKIPNRDSLEWKQAEEKIVQRVWEAFINYDLPQSSVEQYLNDVGILQFTRYLKRIQKLIARNLLENPMGVLMAVASQMYIMDTEDIYEQNIFNKHLPYYVHDPIIGNTVTATIPMPIQIMFGMKKAF